MSSKEKERELYNRFLKTKTFEKWFYEKQRECLKKLAETYQTMLLNADLVGILKVRKEVEILDLYMKYLEQIVSKKLKRSDFFIS